MSNPATLTATQLDALPTGSVVRYATERGMRPAVAIKAIGYGPDCDKWHSSDSMAPVSSLTIAGNSPVLLAPAPPAPPTFATPMEFEEHLTFALEDAGLASVLIRDTNDRPWIVTWDEDSEAFVISYPEESDEGAMPEPSTYWGLITLPAYPVRLVQEAGA